MSKLSTHPATSILLCLIGFEDGAGFFRVSVYEADYDMVSDLRSDTGRLRWGTTRQKTFLSKVARTVHEAYQLVESGFEYVTEMDDVKIFRKPK